MPLQLSSYQCNCGRTGCLETVAGSEALHALARKGLSENGHVFPVLRQSMNEGTALNTLAILHAAENGDPDCIRLLAQSGRALGTALAAAVMLVNPARIIICSRLDHCTFFTAACEKALQADAFHESLENTRLCFLPLDPLADATGAARLPYRAMFEV